MNTPASIYVWLVPSEHVLEQPGSWRIRKWDTAPFPEATHVAQSMPQTSAEVNDALIDAERWRHFRGLGETDRTVILQLSEGQGHLLEHFIDKSRCGL